MLKKNNLIFYPQKDRNYFSVDRFCQILDPLIVPLQCKLNSFIFTDKNAWTNTFSLQSESKTNFRKNEASLWGVRLINKIWKNFMCIVLIHVKVHPKLVINEAKRCVKQQFLGNHCFPLLFWWGCFVFMSVKGFDSKNYQWNFLLYGVSAYFFKTIFLK